LERLFKLNPVSDLVNEYLNNIAGNKELYGENELKQTDTLPEPGNLVGV